KRFPIFHYHTFYKALHPFEDTVVSLNQNKGYDPVDGVEPYEGPLNYMELASDPVSIGELNLRYLEDISDYCKKNGTALLVLSLPSPPNYSMETHKAVQEWSETHDADYLDLNLIWEELGIDWSKDTKDGGDHMNPSGAEKVSLYLSKYLEANYDLLDHRSDESYDKWNRDYDKLYN
ncbi:MAG: hypothetical protein K6B14_00845, partial [Lachnospiraceae bacterium]|nr:hypothetical protein [Lachnospiraceae bacterium]